MYKRQPADQAKDEAKPPPRNTGPILIGKGGKGNGIITPHPLPKAPEPPALPPITFHTDQERNEATPPPQIKAPTFIGKGCTGTGITNPHPPPQAPSPIDPILSRRCMTKEEQEQALDFFNESHAKFGCYVGAERRILYAAIEALQLRVDDLESKTDTCLLYTSPSPRD